MGICPKVNGTAWQEFKVTYFEAVVQPFTHYNSGMTTIDNKIENEM